MKVVQLHKWTQNSDPQTSPLGPQKDKNDPKIKPNSNVRIQGIIENESCSTTRVDSKMVFEPNIEPKNRPLGPEKVKNDPIRIEGNKRN